MAVKYSIDDIKVKATGILASNGVRRASLFGSVARGEGGENSDIDLLVELDNDRTLLDLVEIKLELEELLNRKVDVVTYDSLNPYLRERILKEQIVIL